MRFILKAALIINLCLSLSGCTPFTAITCILTGVGATSYIVYRDKNFGDTITDSRIKLLIHNEFRSLKNKNATDDIKVYVNNGIVLLLGFTDSNESIEKLEQMVWKLNGVRSVKNHIGVKDIDWNGGRDVAKDYCTTYMCKSETIVMKGAKSPNFKIVTYNGTVYILGLYRNRDELNVIIDRMKNTKNVKRVVSYAEHLKMLR